MDGIIFDVDGTIWDSTDSVAASWNKMIEMYSDLSLRVDRDALHRVFGKTMEDICNILFSELPEKERILLGNFCFDYENEYLKEHPGELYPGVYDTIKLLSKQVPLFIVSNCQQGYVEICIETTGLDPFITGHLCYGDTLTSKGKTIQMLMKQYNLQDVVYVGDTFGDYQACKEAGVPFIFVSYGFGEVPEAERRIDTMNELPQLLGLTE